MKIKSKRFGEIEVREDRTIKLEGGLLGFQNNMEKFFLVDDPEDPGSPFKWLISVDDPEYGFLVTDPGIFYNDYIVELSKEDRAAIGLTSEEEASVLTLLTIPRDARKITANLRAPLIINSRTMTGRQVVLTNDKYTTKHFVFVQIPEKDGLAERDPASELSGAAGTHSGETVNNTEVQRSS